MLGGYIEDNRITGKSGVPILKDIPLLGALFRSRNNNKTVRIALADAREPILRNPMDSGAHSKQKKPGCQASSKPTRNQETEEQSIEKGGLTPQRH